MTTPKTIRDTYEAAKAKSAPMRTEPKPAPTWLLSGEIPEDEAQHVPTAALFDTRNWRPRDAPTFGVTVPADKAYECERVESRR